MNFGDTKDKCSKNTNSYLILIVGALVYAELGTVVPRSGSEYVYYMEDFGSLHKFWGPLPGFIFSFIIVLLLRPVGIAVIVLTSAEYIVKLIREFVCLDDEDGDIEWLTHCTD